ncbi:MAG: Ig-like domain-containing protein, partial [Anaeromyxobacteraceae bacterium]
VGAITVSSSTGSLPGAISYDSTTKTAIFTPSAPCAPLTGYTVTVDAKVKSVTTARLPGPYLFAFRSGVGISAGSTPITTSVEATSIDQTGATLNGTVNPDGLATHAWFEYGADPGLLEFASTAHQDVGNGLADRPVSTRLSGLSPGTTYYFRVCAENDAGLSGGRISSFTTASSGSPPAVTTVAATSGGATGATLNGSVIPNGLATDAWFEWGTDVTLASFATTGTQAVGSGTTSQAILQALTGLTTGTTYHYRVAASNGAGTSRGAVLSFRPGAPPAVTTLTTTGVGTTGATLNGTANPNGLETDAWFEWGTSPGLAAFATTAIQAVGAGTSPQPTTATLSGLSPATTYFYRAVAANSTGSTKGSTESFTTTSPESFGVVSTSPANNATGVPLGDPITVTFNRDVEPATLVGAITVSSVAGDLPGVISYDSTTKTAIFTPVAPLAPLTDYTVTVAAKVKSVTTARLLAPYVFTFRSGA